MNDKQTTAGILLAILATVFWLYNSKSTNGTTNKLKAVVSEITGQVNTLSATSPTTSYSPAGVSLPGTAPTNSPTNSGTNVLNFVSSLYGLINSAGVTK